MSEFLNATISDMRSGRESWRVIVALSSPAFAIAVVISLMQF